MAFSCSRSRYLNRWPSSTSSSNNSRTTGSKVRQPVHLSIECYAPIYKAFGIKVGINAEQGQLVAVSLLK
jgi:hypothetical protein